MKVATGRVVDGKVVLEGEPLAEGAIVTLVARDDDELFDGSPEEERALLEAMTQADQGRTQTWDHLNAKRKTQNASNG